MPNRLKVLRTTAAGTQPPTGVADDYGRLAINLTDSKMWAYNAAGTPSLIGYLVTDHSASKAYRIGDLVVQAQVLYSCIVNIPPKAFTSTDWQSVSDFRGELLYRAPTQQVQATMTMGTTGISFRVTANAGQVSDLMEWRNGADQVVSTIRPDGYPGPAFGRPTFRVDQVAHSFTAVGQPARFDGTNWVLADANTEAGFAIAVVKSIINANAFELQVAGRIDGMQNAAFESGAYVANSRYYVSVATPGKLTVTPPPDPADANPVLHTLSGGAAIINVAFPLSASGGGGTATTQNVTQNPNPFTAVGQVAAYSGAQWALANPATASLVPIGLISATAGFNFSVVTSGLITGITAGACVVFPLTPGQAYYANAAGLLTATPPTSSPLGASPILWAISGASGVVMPGQASPNLLRASQNLADLASIPTALTNLGLNDVVRTSRTLTAGTGLTGGGDLSANRSFALSAGSIASLALADTAVQPTRQVNTTGTGLTGGGDLSANRTIALAGQALAFNDFGGTGILIRTGDAAFTSRSIAAGDGIGVTNGSGITGNPSIAVDVTVVRTSRSVLAGDGITGGGTLAADRTIAVDSTVVRTTGDQTVGGIKTFSTAAVFSAGLSLPDSAAIVMGTGNDFSIVHNGSDTILTDSGTGSLLLRSSGIVFQNVAGTETMLSAAQDGAVTLFFNNSAWLATNANGVQLEGTITGGALATLAEAEGGVTAGKLLDTVRGTDLVKARRSQTPNSIGLSGTAVTFTNIPTDVLELYVELALASLSGAGDFAIQLGTPAAGIVSAGYSSVSSIGSARSEANNCFIIRRGNGTAATGIVTLRRLPQTNLWTSTHTIANNGENSAVGGGVVNLATAADRLQFTRTTAVNFTAGDVRLEWVR